MLGGKMTAARGEAALSDLARFAAVRHRVEPLLPRIWALRANLNVYDGSYVALAETLDAVLVTADLKLDTPTVRRLITIAVINR